MKRPRGRWSKAYESTVHDKAAYTNPQWRAFTTVLMLGAANGGTFSSRGQLVALLDAIPGATGEELVTFLVAQHDIKVRAGGRGRVEVVGWETYQGPPPDRTGAERTRRWREKQAAGSDASRDGRVTGQPPVWVPINDEITNERDAVTHRHVSVSDSLSESPRLPRGEPPSENARGTNGHTNGNAAFDPGLWARVGSLAEELIGRSYALGSPYGGLGAKALDQAASCDWPRFEGAYRQVAAVYGRPTARQLVFDAEDALRPTGLASVKPTREDRARAEVEEAMAGIRASRTQAH